MIKRVYSVFDVKAEMYGPPIFMKTDGEALRAFMDLCEDKNTMPGRHPGDFKIVYLCDFDDLKGTFENFPASKTLAFGSDLVASGNVVPLGVKNG